MKVYNKNNLLKSIKHAIQEPKESKYIKKIVCSVNRHLRGKKYAHFSACESFYIGEQFNESTRIRKSSGNFEEVDLALEQVTYEDSTIDSGVMTLKDEIRQKSPKTLSFSPRNIQVVEVDVEKYQPKYYDMPEKCIAHIAETPKPKTVDYRKTRTSTPQQPSEEITTEVLQEANLIRNHHCEPQLMLDLTFEDKSFVRSPRGRHVDDKFVVNLYESRQSNRWKRRGICFPHGALQLLVDEKPEAAQQSQQTGGKTSCPGPWSEQEQLNGNDLFLKLKKERDVECVKMKQASNVLKIMRKSSQAECSDKLLAEKILLEADEKHELLINKIREIGYTEVIPSKPSHAATATLTNFEFFLEPQEFRHSKYSDFYIVTLSHGTELLMSKVVSPDDNKLIFDEKYTFGNLNSEFTITVKIFTIRLRISGRNICSLLGKKTKNWCPMSKIYYENVNTCEMEASSVLKTAFRCCGEFQLTKDHIDSTNFALSKIPADSTLIPDVTFAFKIDNLRIDSKASGFLTLGIPNKQNEVLFWERKWCVLNGANFSIYNYPSEEDFGEPICSINLEYCLTPILKNCEGCPKKKNFLLKTGKPSTIYNRNDVALTLRRKSNFVVQKYFFSADNCEDFELWTNKLQLTLNCLQDWQKLFFLDDYC